MKKANKYFKKSIICLTMLSSLFVCGCSEDKMFGETDYDKGVYENKYSDFVVTEKLNYKFTLTDDTMTTTGHVTLFELFRLEDEDTKDVVKGYYTDDAENLDVIIDLFIEDLEKSKDITKTSDLYKNGDYMSIEFESNSIPFKVSFKESNDHHLIFIMTCKKDSEKHIRYKYTNYIRFE